jgi:site-specific recombinase XerD
MRPQTVMRNDPSALARQDAVPSDGLERWVEAYFQLEVTTATSSQVVQRRDLELFLRFMRVEEGHDHRPAWSPRLSRAFVETLRNELTVAARRRYGDRTINRIIAHLKTFARWIHGHRPFPLGDPMDKLRALPTASLLAVERAITPAERRRLLDAADLLLQVGGRSRDRGRYRRLQDRPRHKGHRPYRNRAVVYLLIETGMRRAAVVDLDLEDVDFAAGTVEVREKGGARHTYQASQEGLNAVGDYLEHERPRDGDRQPSPALFLPDAGNAKGTGRLSPLAVNRIWNAVAKMAGVAGKTPHAARHAMGRHIVERTGNIAAVQRQLGHKNAAYSMQYARITAAELRDVLNDR